MFALLISACFAALLIGGWGYAWLRWIFDGNVRQWLCATFPESWRAFYTRRRLAGMSGDDIRKFLMMESSAPGMILKLLICHVCMSAHVAFWGAVILTVAAPGLLPLFPLYWACGAALAMKLYSHA